MDDGREDKLPWTKWSWSEWAADYGVRAVSLTARGLWMEMLSIMARSKKRGYLLDGEKQMESKTLAKIVSISTEETDRLLGELRTHGVFSETVDGIIYNRRMAREGEISEIRAEAGSHGGRPVKQSESKTKAKRKQKVFGCKSKTKAASISSSISSSISFNEGVWGGIEDSDVSAWSKAYPACDVPGELRKMAEWLKANPDKRKIRYRRFIVNWLARTQDRSGSGSISARDHRSPDPPHIGASIQSGKDIFREQYEKNKAKEGTPCEE